LVSAVNFFYFKSLIFDKKVASISSAFEQQRDFATIAKEILNTNKEVAYAKLVDENGVLQQSFGSSENLNIKEFIIKNPEGSQIFLGIEKSALTFPMTLPLLLTTLISLLVLCIFLIVIKLYYPYQKKSLNILNDAILKISKGDYSSKLEIGSQLKDDVDMIKVFDSFNEMADSLNSDKNYEKLNGAGELNASNGDLKVHGNGTGTTKTQSYNDPIIQEPIKSVELPKAGGQISIIKDSKNKTVVALVSKISDYDRLAKMYDSSELALLLTDYRKTASNIVSGYGGIVETLVRDELVALFNVSELQDKPELRAVSAGVELLHMLVELNKDKVKDGNRQITCKIGVFAASIPISKESGTPGNLGLVIDPAKSICDNASEWKLLLSEDVYASVKDYVEVMPQDIGSHAHYSVLTVEEGVINL
jgi:class 3 adenylate cyclase